MARAQPKHTPMDGDELRPADEAILDVLSDGRATKGMLIDETGYSRNTVYNRLEVLQAADHVRTAHERTRLFELVSDPRDDSTHVDAPAVADGGFVRAFAAEADGDEWEPFDCPECGAEIETGDELREHARECFGWDV